MRSILVPLSQLAVLLLFVGCQSAPELDYPQLSEKISSGDRVDVAALRDAFLEQEDLPRHMERLVDLEQQALQIVEDEPLKLGSIGSAILDTYYGSLTGHYVMTRFYEHVSTPSAAEPHHDWVARIREDMEAAGDGSREQPYPAVTAVEAQMYAISQGQYPVGSIYQTTEAHPFAILLQVKPDEGPIRNVTFDLSGMYGAVRTDFTRGAEADDDDFTPFSLIGFLAKRDDTAAQAAIGAFLASQERTGEATDWLRASSRKGNLVASSVLARLYWEKASEATDEQAREAALEEVLENYLHAIALGSTDAMYALGVLYLNGHYGEENKTSGITLLTQAADAEHSDAAMFLAHLYYAGEVVDRQLDKARAYYIQASELENPFAQRSYARFLLDRDVGQDSDPRAIEWLENLARADDDAEAMLLLGNLHARGLGIRQNFRRAVSWYKDAVEVAPEDASIINEVAWTLAVSNLDGLKRERYALEIMDALMDANEAARSRPEYLDTWAAAHAANGDFDRAIALQQEALTVAEEMEFEEVLDILKEHLKAFREGETITEVAP